MTTIVNTPPNNSGGNNWDSGLNMIIWLVLLLIVWLVFFMYGYPYLQDMMQDKTDINVNIKLPAEVVPVTPDPIPPEPVSGAIF